VVKIAKHVRFDEGMNDLPPDLVPPNVVHLQRTQNGKPLPAETEETSVDQFTFHLNPFSCTMVKGVQVTDDDPSYVLANQTSPFSPSPTLNLIHERDLRRTDIVTSISS